LRARHSGCGLSDIGYLWSNPNQNHHEMMMKIIREGHESRLAKYCFSEKMTVTHMSWSHIIAYNQTSYGIDHGNMCQLKVDQLAHVGMSLNSKIPTMSFSNLYWKITEAHRRPIKNIYGTWIKLRFEPSSMRVKEEKLRSRQISIAFLQIIDAKIWSNPT